MLRMAGNLLGIILITCQGKTGQRKVRSGQGDGPFVSFFMTRGRSFCHVICCGRIGEE